MGTWNGAQGLGRVFAALGAAVVGEGSRGDLRFGVISLVMVVKGVELTAVKGCRVGPTTALTLPARIRHR